MPVEKSAGAVIFTPLASLGVKKHEGKRHYLLLHYELGHWDFPKGHIEKDEEMQDTVRREIKEETGIEELEFIEGFKQTIKYFFKWEGENIMKFVTFFLVKSKTKEVKLSFEHIGYEWLSYNQALEKLTFKAGKEILQKSEEFLNQK